MPRAPPSPRLESQVVAILLVGGSEGFLRQFPLRPDFGEEGIAVQFRVNQRHLQPGQPVPVEPVNLLAADDGDFGSVSGELEGFFGRMGDETAVEFQVLVAGEHNVDPFGQRLTSQCVKDLAPHNIWLANAECPKMCKVSRQMPGHPAITPDDAVFSLGSDGNNVLTGRHGSTQCRLRTQYSSTTRTNYSPF